MKVFLDLHHFDLFHSFQLLFRRLGYKLYRPIGLDWLSAGFWNICMEPVVVTGYLSTENGKCADTLANYPDLADHSTWARYAIELLRVGSIEELSDGIYHIQDKSKGENQLGITLEAFKDTRFDIIISSVPHHFPLYERLLRLCQPHAKHIFHMGPGNAPWEVPNGARNIMVSTPPVTVPAGINMVTYHQEFSLKCFAYKEDLPINFCCYSYIHYPQSEELMTGVMQELPSWAFRFIGKSLGQLEGIIVSTCDLVSSMNRSAFVWHYKPGGESYGHVLHNCFALGRPIVTRISDYKDKVGGRLLEDKVTCIDIEGRDATEIAKLMEYYTDPGQHQKMRQAVHNRFCEVVDFNKEEASIRTFLGALQ